MPSARRSVLATGADLKNTFCVVTDGRAWISQHLGDLMSLASLEAFDRSIRHALEVRGVEPDCVAVDAHPDYLSSRWANRRVRRPLEIQHHHAHVAAVMAEHQLDPAQPVIGFAFDGTGYGPDGTIWGGEVLIASAAGYRRVAHLAPIPLPGGDTAVRQPARMALAHLDAAGVAWDNDLHPVAHLASAGGPDALSLLRQQLRCGTGCVPTTSMGRLFDAVASLIGLRHRISYEAQAAIELEIAATEAGDDREPGYGFERCGGLLDASPVIRALVDDLAAGRSAPVLARRFHRAVVDLVTEVARWLRAATGIETVALGGGVFQNALLTEWCVESIDRAGLHALTHRAVPPNDGGLALGQAYIAAAGHGLDLPSGRV